MQISKEESIHIITVLESAKSALDSKDGVKLLDLSNKTIHSACSRQDDASITTAVILYALSKIIERQDYLKMKNWASFAKKFNFYLNGAIKSLKDEELEKYEKNIVRARKVLGEEAGNLKIYIQDILKKASINKASKLHEHGISLEHTAKLLGITLWELSEYMGQKKLYPEETKTIDTKSRAKMALEFFS